MKRCKAWVGIGMGAGILLYLITGGETLWRAASASQRASVLVLGSIFLAGSAWYAWKARAKTPRTRPAPGAMSAFSQEPWGDVTRNAAAPAETNLSPAARVALLWEMAHRLEANGRLHAAQELYRQAHDAASHAPEWTARQDEIALAERKVARRLALVRANRRTSRRLWPRRPAETHNESDKFR